MSQSLSQQTCQNIDTAGQGNWHGGFVMFGSGLALQQTALMRQPAEMPQGSVVASPVVTGPVVASFDLASPEPGQTAVATATKKTAGKASQEACKKVTENRPGKTDPGQSRDKLGCDVSGLRTAATDLNLDVYVFPDGVM